MLEGDETLLLFVVPARLLLPSPAPSRPVLRASHLAMAFLFWGTPCCLQDGCDHCRPHQVCTKVDVQNNALTVLRLLERICGLQTRIQLWLHQAMTSDLRWGSASHQHPDTPGQFSGSRASSGGILRTFTAPGILPASCGSNLLDLDAEWQRCICAPPVFRFRSWGFLQAAALSSICSLFFPYW